MQALKDMYYKKDLALDLFNYAAFCTDVNRGRRWGVNFRGRSVFWRELVLEWGLVRDYDEIHDTKTFLQTYSIPNHPHKLFCCPVESTLGPDIPRTSA